MSVKSMLASLFPKSTTPMLSTPRSGGAAVRVSSRRLRRHQSASSWSWVRVRVRVRVRVMESNGLSRGHTTGIHMYSLVRIKVNNVVDKEVAEQCCSSDSSEK